MLEAVNIDKYNQYMNAPVYLSAREAATELGVQPATLYAYVSRGLIRSVPGPGKQRRYDAADVRALQTRRDRESGNSGGPLATEGAPTPALETRLTLITEEGPFYRGHRATDLARSSSLEAVATLLWDCRDDPFAGVSAPEDAGLLSLPDGLPPLERLMTRLATWPLVDRSASVQTRALLAQKGARLLLAGVSALLERPFSTDPVHVQMAEAWGVTDPAAREAIRAALVLSADHELNTSAYAVRCAASTRAPLHACLLAGLGAFSGPRHGAHSDRVLAWLKDVDEPDTVAPLFRDRLERGEDLPGFGHMLYAGPDPRATCLLDLIRTPSASGLFLESLPTVIAAAEDMYGLAPNIDFALAALQRACGLPRAAPKLLFCAGRLVGWIAHAMEQYEQPALIRPRAAYVGPRPA